MWQTVADSQAGRVLVCNHVHWRPISQRRSTYRAFERKVTFSVGLETLNERLDPVYRYGSKDLRLTIISTSELAIVLTILRLIGGEPKESG